MSNFNIGDKVVCVDDKFPPDISKLYDALPVKDTTYVVRDIRLGINLTCPCCLSASSIRRRIPRQTWNAVFAPTVSARSKKCKTKTARRLKKKTKRFNRSRCSGVSADRRIYSGI
jgi:hypothetical protein